MSTKFVGIDFGACNIKAAVSYNDKTKPLKLNKNQAEGNETPNIILYDLTKGVIEKKVGLSAKKLDDPDNQIQYIKRKLEMKEWSQYIANLQRDVSAMEAAKDIFSWIWNTISRQIAKKEEELQAVITVPVCFSEVQKKRIRDSAAAAGVNIFQVVTEPFAALFSIEDVLDDEEGEQVVVIFDFGGSTLDLSLLQIENDGANIEITELAAAGMPYGGIDIDEAIYHDIIEHKYADEVKAIQEADDLGIAEKELIDLSSQLKESLFCDDDEEVSDFYTDRKNGMPHEFVITKQEVIAIFEKYHLKERIIKLLNELFDSTDEVERQDVTKVQPFGGTSYILYFQDLLGEYFGTDIFDRDDCEMDNAYTGIAVGAAKYLSFCEDGESMLAIHSVMPFQIGVAQGDYFHKYISRNERYGFSTPFNPLTKTYLEDIQYCISVYQYFGSEERIRIDDEDGPVFMGQVQLDKSKYTAPDAILMKMKISETGQLELRFFETQGQGETSEIVLIEEKVLQIGE